MGSFIVIVAGFVALVFLQLLFAVSRYIKCPPDKILIIYGRVSADPNEKYLIRTSGAEFVWPVIQNYQFIDAGVEEMEISCKAHFKDNRPIAANINFKYQISKEEKAIKKAVDLFFGKEKKEVNDTIQYQLKNAIEKVISQHTASDFDLNPTALKTAIEETISNSLTTAGIKLITLKQLNFS